MRRLTHRALLLAAATGRSTSTAAAPPPPTASFAANLFHGRAVCGELFPYPQRRFGADEGSTLSELVDAIRAVAAKPAAAAALMEAGVGGARVQTTLGGLELSHTAQAFATEEAARTLSPEAIRSGLLPLLPHATLVAGIAGAVGGDDEGQQQQRSRLLRLLTPAGDDEGGDKAAAAVVVGWAALEPGSEFDVSAGTAVAEPLTTGGGALGVTGAMVVPGGASATHFFVLARTATQVQGDSGPELARRLTFFLVDRAAALAADPRCIAVAPLLAGGAAATADAVVTFAKCPVVEPIGVAGDGFVQHVTALHSTAASGPAALSLGLAKRALEALRGAIARTPSGELAEGAAAAAAAVLARGHAELFALESAVYAVAANLDAQTPDALIDSAVTAALVYSTTHALVAAARDAALGLLDSSSGSANAAAVGDVCEAAALLAAAQRFAAPADYLRHAAALSGCQDFGETFQSWSTLAAMQHRLQRRVAASSRVKLPGLSGNAAATAVEQAIVAFGAAVEATFLRKRKRLATQGHRQLSALGEAAGLLYAGAATLSRAAADAKAATRPQGGSNAAHTAAVANAVAKQYAERAAVLSASLLAGRPGGPVALPSGLATSPEVIVAGTPGSDEVYQRLAVEAAEAAFAKK